MEKKKKYNVLSVIKRMLAHLWEQDRKQYGRIFLYTLMSGQFFQYIQPPLRRKPKATRRQKQLLDGGGFGIFAKWATIYRIYVKAAVGNQ